jgi:ribosome-binding factor A
MMQTVARPGHHKGYRRNVRVGEALREVLAEAIERRVDDPADGLVTVTHVDAAPDLKTARVYVSVLGGSPEAALADLAEAAPDLQKAIARHLRLMWTPRLSFHLDTGTEQAFRIDRLLDEG